MHGLRPGQRLACLCVFPCFVFRMAKRPRENLEVHWHQREQTEAAMAAVLGEDIFISEIICLLGLHRARNLGVWRKKKHWTKGGCGQGCGCCRAKNKEDWPSGCKACLDMWNLTIVNRQWMKLTKEFDGITETMRTGCNKKQRTYQSQIKLCGATRSTIENVKLPTTIVRPSSARPATTAQSGEGEGCEGRGHKADGRSG